MPRPGGRSPAIRSRAGPTSRWSTGAARRWGCRPALSNDSDAAGLAEALFGAGRGHRVVFYINVGSGIGGALVIDGRVYSGGHGIASEIGHLRPGLDADDPHATVESLASGFGIAAAGRAWLAGENLHDPSAADLLARCGGRIDQLSGRMVCDAAAAGNAAAQADFARALQTFGWAIAQMITLVAPQVVVIGGGVPLAGETMFFEPLRRASGPLRLPAAGPCLFDRPGRAGRGSGGARGAGGGERTMSCARWPDRMGVAWASLKAAIRSIWQATEGAAEPMPSGWAAVLELYGLR